MPIGLRSMVVGGAVLATGAVVGAWSLPQRRATDPCDANPAIHACAVFVQPDWLKRRVYAGRTDQAGRTPAPAAGIEAVTVATGPSRDGI